MRYNANMEDLIKKLEIYRLENRISQKQLADRLKVRLRWYGKSGIGNPCLELKLKKSMLGGKIRFLLNPGLFDPDNANEANLHQLFINLDLDPGMLDYMVRLKPTLNNSYRRKYFLSSDRKFRITLDTNLEYYRPIMDDAPAHIYSDNRSTVIELKYAPEDDFCSRAVSQSFPFPVTKNSKYITGIDSIYYS